MKHTIKGHLYWQMNQYMKEPAIVFMEYDLRNWDPADRDGRVWISAHSFEVEVPDDFDPRPEQIAALKAEKTRLNAEFSAKVTEIDRRISKLQAIEMAS